LSEQAMTADDLLTATSLDPAAGRRFIDLLVSLGLITRDRGGLKLSRFSNSWLNRNSATNQRHTVAFEQLLLEKWDSLGTVLKQGQGSLIAELEPEEYRQRLQLYQGAMGEAAVVRAEELWSSFPIAAEQGAVIDLGAGDSTYLRAFLSRHPHWQGIACDLPAVCALAANNPAPDGLRFSPCNLLDPHDLEMFVDAHRTTADLLLMSNFCHCYSPREINGLLRVTDELLGTEGKLLIHDFFRDINQSGALYDLHMLVNTLNGRTYAVSEMSALLADAGFMISDTMELQSGSRLLIAVRTGD
jgi:hypothetical protein